MVRTHVTDKRSPIQNKPVSVKTESTPITTRSGTSLGRAILSNVTANLFPSFASNNSAEKTSTHNNSVGNDSDVSNESEGTNVDARKSISVQTDASGGEKLAAKSSDSDVSKFSLESDEMYELHLPAVIYNQSDNEWPVREAILFR